ncbi:hypothetical protein JKG68_07485 [Microvirga aerilata]|uniref:Uncharacterized protein n=1 Tax=Microvirga aerilata TaxID=670292 RepID=A0A937CYT6_9HYPH|nr:hypothetical protein [Microvirga aerilata]MBL0403801.1 hypothetical protein [Microvirga aerilata]
MSGVNWSPRASRIEADILQGHDPAYRAMEISKPFNIRLTVPLMALPKLSSELLLDGFRTIPYLQPLPVHFILDLDVSQSGKR